MGILYCAPIFVNFLYFFSSPFFLLLIYNDSVVSIFIRIESWGGRSRSLVWSLSVVLLILTGCTIPVPNLQPEDVYTRPEILYKNFKDVVVFVDMKGLPEAQREPAIVSTTETGLRERGLDIIDHNAYMSFLRKKGISPSESGNQRLLVLLKEELGRSAIIRVRVDVFMVQGKLVDPLRTVTPGVPGSRGTGATPMDVALRDRREWVIDFSLAFDMFDTSTAEKIWSCSLTCFQSAYEGKLGDFIRKAVAVCLDTIPVR